MVYENTHLWAANVIRRQINNNELKKIIAANMDHYHLGAIFPDTFYFNNNKEIRNVADSLHGDSGSPTNTIVFEVLDETKHTRDEKNLAFICGFLTHFAMDIVFHPLVFYLSGYKTNSNSKERAQSSYLHWHYETFIDKRFNDEIFLEQVVKSEVIKELTIIPILELTEKTIRDCLSKQISYFKRIHSHFFYLVYRALITIGWLEKKYIAGFYANLDVEQKQLPEKIAYRDIITGEDKEASLEGLMTEAVDMGVKMVESAYDYYAGKISRHVCERVVIGNNLDTGEIGRTKSDIKFSINS